MHENAIGTTLDEERAAALYAEGAKLGNFGCITGIGKFYTRGTGVQRSARKAMEFQSAAMNIGPWIGWLRRGLDLYLHEDYYSSVVSYFHAGELGLEVSQSNSAYILRSKMSHTKPLNQDIVIDGTEKSLEATQEKLSISESDLIERLRARQYFLSSAIGNKDSALELGHCYFKGQCGLPNDYDQAVLWYTKANHMGQPLGAIYLGVIHQFGLGGIEINPIRASRYYNDASNSQESLNWELSILLTSLRGMLSLKKYSIFSPINIGVDYVMRTLWG